MSEHESANTLPSRTTPTWEVELLISGVAVFAMLQLPGYLDQAFFWIKPRFAEDWRQLAMIAYVYAKSATLILAATFVLHLMSRARWIALVGMHSVYPDGIRWHKLKLSSVQRDVLRDLDKPFSDRIERADNIATTVFAIGVTQAMLMGAVAAGAIVFFGSAKLIAYLSGGNFSTEVWMAVLGAAILLPFGLATLLDRWRGAQWHPENRVRRVVRAMLRGYTRIGFVPSANPIVALIASEDGDRKAGMLTSGLMFLSLFCVALGLMLLDNPNRLGSYAMFPWSSATLHNIDSAHYDDQRDPLRDGTTPYIEGMVAISPYLRLVLPYEPQSDEPAMRKHCSQSDALGKQQRSKARLDCLAALHPVQLDGIALVDLGYEVASDPRSDRPALLAMIDIRSLATGRHELRIGRAPPAEDEPIKKGSRAERDSQDYVIPFWK